METMTLLIMNLNMEMMPLLIMNLKTQKMQKKMRPYRECRSETPRFDWFIYE